MFGFRKKETITKEVRVSPDFSALEKKEIVDVSWWKWSGGEVKLNIKIKIGEYQLARSFEGKSFIETLDKFNKYWSDNEQKIREISELN